MSKTLLALALSAAVIGTGALAEDVSSESRAKLEAIWERSDPGARQATAAKNPGFFERVFGNNVSFGFVSPGVVENDSTPANRSVERPRHSR